MSSKTEVHEFIENPKEALKKHAKDHEHDDNTYFPGYYDRNIFQDIDLTKLSFKATSKASAIILFL
jgi:hypothetical protein